MKYDVVIIGGGPAGLTASIYCQRRQLKTLVIAKAIGGQALLASEIHNWPGEKSISGFELTKKMHDQAKALAAEFASSEVSRIEKTPEGFSVKAGSENFETSVIILAFGLTPRNLEVPGEEKFTGRGVSYCATCDGPLFKGKTVAVAGGGNAALEAVEYLSKLAKQVYLINNSDKFTAEAELIKQISSIENVLVTCDGQIMEIAGDGKVEKIIMAGPAGAEGKSIAVDGVFVEIGHMPKTAWLKGTVDLNERGEVITDKSGLTSQEGIFAAGDCTDVGFKQMIISAGEGAKAALSAYKHIASKTGGTARPDWGICQKN